MHPEQSQERTEPQAAVESAAGGEAAARQLLEAVHDLAQTLHPHRRRALRITLDSKLDDDLGFDSLDRVELMLRVEQHFHVQLAESLVGEAETPGDLLQAVLTARGLPAQTRSRAAPIVLGAVESVPHELATLTELLDWHCHAHPDRPQVLLDDGRTTTATITYRGLRDAAGAVAGGLQRRGLARGQSVAIMLPTSAEYFYAFFGVLYAGGVPVPIYPPFRPSQLEDHLRRQAGIIANAQAALLITEPEWHVVANLLVDQVPGMCAAETLAQIVSQAERVRPLNPGTHDTALLQYTSGSTGDPKGVVLSHANLLANIRALGEAIGVSDSDIFVSWLPLYHDMGLIGAWLGALYHAVPTAIMSPLRFLGRPDNWLWTIHRYRATLSAAPNFAYELCLRKIEPQSLSGLDLSSVRLLMNGAEAVNPATLREFPAHFSAYGLRTNVMLPVYGLAECSLGLAFPAPGRLPVIDRVQRASMMQRGIAHPAGTESAAPLEFVSCGHALPGHQLRIVDPMGHELDDRHEGRLQFRGPSATRGYFRNPAKTRELFDGEWLQSGDLAYSVEGDLFITGRSKDMIIRAGRHIYPEEIEKAVSGITGVRRGCVAAFGILDPAAGTERIVVVAETRVTDPQARERIRSEIDETTSALLEQPADDIVLAAPHTVLKTSSGKIRRAACRDLYARGLPSVRPPPVWLQIVRLRIKGLRQRVWRLLALGTALAYALWWWVVVLLLALVVWPLVVVLPNRGSRWRVIRVATRGCLWAQGIRLRVSGGDLLPATGAVIVANHSSYLDSIVLSAVLSRPPVFVAKQELAPQFFAGTLLRRIGTLFVERSQVEKSTQATEQAIAVVQDGQHLIFFPEGTLTRMPGLLAFHMGPFLTAAAAGAPVVPLTLRGTRSVLRGDQWFPRHAAVSVAISPALQPIGRDWDAALALRDAARATILQQVAEPDLSDERIRF